jgi:hypothetical protein
MELPVLSGSRGGELAASPIATTHNTIKVSQFPFSIFIHNIVK